MIDPKASAFPYQKNVVLYNDADRKEPAQTIRGVWTGGMDIRTYFAAHAPAEPPSWFQPVMPPKPQPPAQYQFSWEGGLSLTRDGIDHLNCVVRAWYRDPCFDLAAYKTPLQVEHIQHDVEAARPTLARIAEVRLQYLDDVFQWDREKLRQRYAQWPWAWADLVLASADGGAQ